MNLTKAKKASQRLVKDFSVQDMLLTRILRNGKERCSNARPAHAAAQSRRE